MHAVLDNPIWHALTGRHAGLGTRRGNAARYRTEVAIFAGYAEPTAEALLDLAALAEPGEVVVVLGVEDASSIGPEWQVLDGMSLVQMVCDSKLEPPNIEPRPLGPGDVDEMLALVELTQPGPFGRETIEMGSYIGVRRDGALIAMAGERLAPPGHTEISAVCTHPEETGRGLGEALVRAVGATVQARGEVAFLHVLEENTRAIALYERLGFHQRRVRNITPMVRIDPESVNRTGP